MQHKHKPHLDCGIDGMNVLFHTNYELEQDIYYFTRNECNKKIEYATLKKLKATNEQIEYALYVNLPKILRNTNIQPYSVLDCTKYARVYYKGIHKQKQRDARVRERCSEQKI